MKYLFYIIVVIFLLTSCKSEYQKLIEKELAAGQRNTDLFLDLTMGQTRKEFFAICWDLNKEKKISQGSGNQYAKYFLRPSPGEDSTRTVEILFYGMFDQDDVMYGMDMKMSFSSWSPWNKDFHTDVLQEFMEKKYMEQEGGNPFIQIQVTDEVNALVKVDGNKQILMYPNNNQTLSVKIEDLEKDLYNLPKS